MGDIPRPLKTYLPEYMRIEKRLDIMIKLAFGISTDLEIQEIVHTFDDMSLKSEAIVRGGDINWVNVKYADVELIPFFTMHHYSPWVAKEMFLNRWRTVENV